jgi:hypothetical protein
VCVVYVSLRCLIHCRGGSEIGMEAFFKGLKIFFHHSPGVGLCGCTAPGVLWWCPRLALLYVTDVNDVLLISDGPWFMVHPYGMTMEAFFKSLKLTWFNSPGMGPCICMAPDDLRWCVAAFFFSSC